MSNVYYLEVGVMLLAAGALLSLLLASSRKASGWTGFVFVLGAAVALWLAVAGIFTNGTEPEINLLGLEIIGARLAIAVDPLAAIFLAIVATIAALSTFFSIDYMTMRHYQGNGVAKYYPVLLVFFISMVGVLAVADFFFFLVFWELMTLSSFFLVIYERESPVSQRAGLKYFIITHVATLCMVAGALILWNTSGSFHFAAMRETLGSLLATRPVLGHTVIFLLAIGFATKAGVLPMGDWLPDAHPVAPSGMSAMLSGALVKLGIYGLLRLFLSIVPVSPGVQIWGMVLAVFGAASCLIGNVTALGQTDSKRLMAFSTIGQIGYICLALGVGIYCLPGRPVLAALGFMGCLFHTINHACFKSCLFLSAGSVLYCTGERDMNKLGGLGASMPVTFGTTTVAALSIAGVPPFNGFASKWLILVTCILVGLSSPLFLILGLIGLFVSLATLAAFLKVLGSVFLGSPREDRDIKEVSFGMALPQIILASLCVLIGVFPRFPLVFVHGALTSLPNVAIPRLDSLMAGTYGITLLSNGGGVAFWNPVAILLAIAALSLATYAIQRSASASVRQVPVWACGEEHGAELIRYRAGGFYLPFKQAFEGIYPRYRLRAPRFPQWLREVLKFDSWFYEPVVRVFDNVAIKVSKSHVGIPQIYLLWIVIGALVVGWIMLSMIA